MSEFCFRTDFKYVSWPATLITNLYRSIAAGVVWMIIALVSGHEGLKLWETLAMPVLFPIGYFVILLPLGLGACLLSRMGIPYIGLLNVVCSLMIIFGDPLLWLIHIATDKKYIPVKHLNIINFSTVLFVVDEERKKAALAQ